MILDICGFVGPCEEKSQIPSPKIQTNTKCQAPNSKEEDSEVTSLQSVVHEDAWAVRLRFGAWDLVLLS